MTVRIALPGEADAVAEVAAATFASACPASTPRHEIEAHIAAVLTPAAFAAHLTDPARVVLVTGEAPFDGYAMLVVGEPADEDVRAAIRVRPTAELSKIYVRAPGDGRGTAAALMARALEVAAERGAAGIWLGTNVENERAQRFYARHGFARVGTKTFRLGSRIEHDLVLERPLA